MKITVDEVGRVAALARLELEDAETERLAADLSSILGYIEKLAELDTDNVVPTTSVVSSDPPLREDVVTSKVSPEKAVANAPDHEGSFFVVPSIIE